MYKLVNQLNNTRLKRVARDVLYVIDEKKDLVELLKDGFKPEKLMAKGDAALDVFLPGQGVLVYANNQLLYKGNGKQAFIPIITGVEPAYLWQDKILVSDFRDGKMALALLDLDGNCLWEQNIIPAYDKVIEKDALFLSIHDENMNVASNIINKISASNGECRVLIDFDRHFKEHGVQDSEYGYYFIGYHNDTLICIVKTRKILGIDPDNGLVRWEISEWTNLTGEEVKGFIKGPVQGGFYDGSFYLLEGNYFACFDFEKQKALLRKIIRTDINGNNIFIKKSIVSGNRIYFTAENVTTRRWNILGVFDIEKENVIWSTEITLPKGHDISIALEADEQYIYLNDTTGTLYIFGKEA